MACYDGKGGLIWFPNFLRHNRPESPNVLKSWRPSYDDLPECALGERIFTALGKYAESLGKAYAEAFQEASGKPFGDLSESLSPTFPESGTGTDIKDINTPPYAPRGNASLNFQGKRPCLSRKNRKSHPGPQIRQPGKAATAPAICANLWRHIRKIPSFCGRRRNTA